MLLLLENSQTWTRPRTTRKAWVKFDSFSSSNNSFSEEEEESRNKSSTKVNFFEEEVDLVEREEKVLQENERLLRSCCSYFYDFDGETSTCLLHPTPPGTFLIRPSSSSVNLFTLSINTQKGPTSVRLIFENCKFRLDAADPRLVSVLPLFDNVPSLVQYYVQNREKKNVWVDGGGRTHSFVFLERGYRGRVLDLKGLCRVVVNRNKLVNNNSLPTCLRKYLNEYPFVL